MASTRPLPMPAVASAARTEAVLASLFDSNGTMIDLVSLFGSEGSVSLPVRAITLAALQSGAASVILAHNHPSGDPRPSQRDIAETRRLERLLFPLSIRLDDHVILAGTRRFSFREAGLL